MAKGKKKGNKKPNINKNTTNSKELKVSAFYHFPRADS